MDKNNGVQLSTEINVNRIMSAFFYDIPENFDYAGERHQGWEFVYVEKGKISVQADDSKYILKSGEMVCHKPFEFHALKPYHGKASVIVFCFECDSSIMSYFNYKILSISQRQKHYLNDILENAGVLLLPKEPLDISRDGSMDRSPLGTISHEQYIKNAIELLLLSLMRSESTECSKRIESYEQHLHRRTLTKDIIAFLNDNLSSDIKLTDISEKFSYSLSSIKRIFKTETGNSIIDYLNLMRIEKAKEYLDNGYSVEETANITGFSNIYYFSNIFKNKTGKSPSKYRQEALKKK